MGYYRCNGAVPMTPTMDEYTRGRFTRLAKHAAEHSNDPSTQNAAEWGPEGTPVIRANQLSTGCELPPDATREYKLQVMEHAERGCIYAAIEYTVSARYVPRTMYALWAACPDCARAIVLAGIRTVYSLAMPTLDRWRESVATGDMILERGGVKHVRFPLPTPPLGVTIRFSGQELLL